MAANIGNSALKNLEKSKLPQQKQPTKPPTPLLSEYKMRPLTPVLSEYDMRQLRLRKDSLKPESNQKAAHWSYTPLKQTPTPSKGPSPKPDPDPTPRSKNHHTEEQLDTLLKQGIAVLIETARADSLLAEDNLNKLKLAIMKDLTTPQAQSKRQNSESPENRRIRGESPILPRRTSQPTPFLGRRSPDWKENSPTWITPMACSLSPC
jgi:hypothetical protein